MDLNDLKSGMEFGPYEIALSEVDASSYVSATGDETCRQDFGGAHPLHLDAYVLSQLISEIGIVEQQIETIHAGQQMTINRPVPVDSPVLANSVLKSCSNRRGTIWAVFETTFDDPNGGIIAKSSSTIILMP